MVSSLLPGDIEYQLKHYYDNQGGVVTGVSIGFFVGASIAVVLRLLARRFTGAGYELDDYVIIVALVNRLI